MNNLLKKFSSVAILSAILLSITAPAFAAEFNKKPLNPDTSDWIVYENPDPDVVEDTPLDASAYVDAPAGKHGFVVGSNSDLDFVFEDGTTIEFNGTNIHRNDCVMNYDELIDLAKSLAQSGMNMVRIFFDDNYSKSGLWGRKGDNGPIFEPDQMDKFFFLLNEFKKRGIYVNIQFTYGSGTTADTDVFEKYDIPEHSMFFDPVMIQRQKDFIEMFLTQYNPYTGMRICDDPGIAAILLRNEVNLVSIRRSVIGTGYYAQELEDMFNDWVCENYGSTKAELETAWAKKTGETVNTVPLKDGEDPALKNLKLSMFGDNNMSEFSGYTAARRVAVLKFYSEVQQDYYNELNRFIEEEIGVKCAISATSVAAVDGFQRATFLTNSLTDFIDNHDYFAQPSSMSYTKNGYRTVPMESLLLGNRDKNLSIIGNQHGLAVYGKPTIISEWDEAYHNLYTGEQALMMMAYSSLNGSHPLGFAWSAAQLTNTKRVFSYNNPDYWAALPTVGRMFLRNDVKEAEAGYANKRFNGDMLYSSSQYMMYNHVAKRISLIGKSGVSFDEVAYDPEYNNNEVLKRAVNAYDNNTPYVSITNEMSTDFDNKVFKLNTDRTQAVTAFFQPTSGGTREIELSDVKFKLDNEYATAYLTSLTDEAIYQTDSMLLTLVGEARNTGLKVADDAKTLTDGGIGPVLCEPISGKVTIKTTDTLDVYPLDTMGRRMGTKVTVTPVDGMAVIDLKRETKAMHYEIIKTTHNDVKPTAVDLADEVVNEAAFDDIEGIAEKTMIERLAFSGIIDKGGSFNPDSAITKQEFAQWLYRALYNTSGEGIWSYEQGYYEKDGNENYKYWQLYALKNGGITTIANPTSTLTRNDVMVMMSKAIERSLWRKQPGKYDISNNIKGCYDYNSASSTYGSDTVAHWTKMFNFGVFAAKNGNIKPADTMTKAEAAKAIFKLMWSTEINDSVTSYESEISSITSKAMVNYSNKKKIYQSF